MAGVLLTCRQYMSRNPKPVKWQSTHKALNITRTRSLSLTTGQAGRCDSQRSLSRGRALTRKGSSHMLARGARVSRSEGYLGAKGIWERRVSSATPPTTKASPFPCARLYEYICTCIYMCILAHAHICAHPHMHTAAHTHMHTLMCVCVCVCVC